MKRKPQSILFILFVVFLIVFLVYYFVDVRDSGLDEGTSPRMAVDLLVENIEKADLEYIKDSTELIDDLAFGDWDEVETVEIGEVRYLTGDDGGRIALVRADFMFSLNLEDEEIFEYPTTLVFVLEKKERDWIVTGVDYSLDRYNEAEKD